jgi:hypothetical protein
LHSDHPSRRILHHVRDADSFLDADAGGFGALKKNRVEYRSPHRQAAIAKSAIPVAGDEFAVDYRPVRRVHTHSRELRRAGALHRIEGSHLREDA